MRYCYLLVITIFFAARSLAIGPISGPSTVCVGSNMTLTNATPGGTWSSSNVLLAAVTTFSGLVTGMGAGYVNITYTVGSGYVTTTITVNPVPPPISGTTLFCAGFSAPLADPVPGTWSSGSTGIVTIDGVTGMMMGISPGSSHITFTSTLGCTAGINVTVNPSPLPIAGAGTVCQGDTLHMSDSTTGGLWTSSSPAIATVGSSSGIVTSALDGVINIYYTISNGCYAIKPVTVHPLAAITGLTGMCTGDTLLLADTVAGGAWSSSATPTAPVDGTGMVLGVAAGTATISYVLPTGCMATRIVTVHPLPVPISGLPEVCVGTTTMLSDSTTPGIFSSEGVYTSVTTGGVVAGIAGGTELVTYTDAAFGCITAVLVTVHTTPGDITGLMVICKNDTTTLSGAPGGAWSSSDTSIATITFATGKLTGRSAGIDTISYSLSAGCISRVVVTVNPLPAPITGPQVGCIGASVLLADTTAGGTWYSSDTTVVRIDDTSGLATGIAAGSASIVYILPTGCLATIPFNLYKPDIPQVCVSSYDPYSGKMVVVWEKVALHRSQTIHIYRQNASGGWIAVGSRPCGAYSAFADTGAYPSLQSYSYRITLTDSCGVESPLDSAITHTTMYLSAMVDTGGVVLTWNNYGGKTATANVIYRSINGAMYDSIATVSATATTFTDHMPPAAALQYMVSGVMPGGCAPSMRTTAYNAVYSNPVSMVVNAVNGPASAAVTIWPNPTTGDVYISGIADAEADVFDAVGRRVATGSGTHISLASLPPGQYLLRLSDHGRAVKTERVIKR